MNLDGYYLLQKMNIRKIRGFTLVELLIVIALIGVLSVAVLATINPIEQSNKARDAKFKNDAAEVLAAYERYYASQGAYPWNSGTGTTVAPGFKITIDSKDASFGVGTDASGVLITTSELKSSFAGKEPFATDVKEVDKLYVYHNGSDSNYVCFHPKANANRTGIVGAGLKCMSPSRSTGGSAFLVDIGVGVSGTSCAQPTTTWTDTDLLNPASATFMCVPEGSIDATGVGGTGVGGT